MLFGHDDQTASVTGDGVGEASGEVVAIRASVLVRDYQLESFAALRDDVNASSSCRRDLGLADRDQVDFDLFAQCVELSCQ